MKLLLKSYFIVKHDNDAKQKYIQSNKDGYRRRDIHYFYTHITRVVCVCVSVRKCVVNIQHAQKQRIQSQPIRLSWTALMFMIAKHGWNEPNNIASALTRNSFAMMRSDLPDIFSNNTKMNINNFSWWLLSWCWWCQPVDPSIEIDKYLCLSAA